MAKKVTTKTAIEKKANLVKKNSSKKSISESTLLNTKNSISKIKNKTTQKNVSKSVVAEIVDNKQFENSSSQFKEALPLKKSSSLTQTKKQSLVNKKIKNFETKKVSINKAPDEIDDDTLQNDSHIVLPEIINSELESHEYENIDSLNEKSDEDSQENFLPVVTQTGLTSTDPLTTYLNEIRKYPVLSKEEEQKIAKKYYETKDPEAAQVLVRANLRFVVKIAAEYARFSNRMIDLIQEGNVGLMHAVKDYNPYKGARLITYAVWWIRGYIQEYLMRQFSMVRIGTTANQRKLFYQLQRQKQELEKMSSPEKIAEISENLGIPKDEVEEMAKRLMGRDVSLDKSTDDDDSGGVSLGQLLKKDDGSLPLDEQLALAEQLEYLKQAIENVKDQLTAKEKIILDERVLNDEPLTLQEIGDKYKITREAVRQNEVRLINKIKEELRKLTELKNS